MNRTSRTARLLIAAAALTITGVLFQTVASFARPTAIEQVAQAKKSTLTVASAHEAAPRAR
jgi:ABC-type enterochelin transport system permease subunit